MLFDAIAIQVNGPQAWDEHLSIDVVLTDVDERYRLTLANGVLTYTARPQRGEADATIESLAAAGIQLTGDTAVLGRLAAALDPGDKDFAIVTTLNNRRARFILG